MFGAFALPAYIEGKKKLEKTENLRKKYLSLPASFSLFLFFLFFFFFFLADCVSVLFSDFSLASPDADGLGVSGLACSLTFGLSVSSSWAFSGVLVSFFGLAAGSLVLAGSAVFGSF